MITISDLGFSYGANDVLMNISMTLDDGRIYGLLGENGVGKTTLLSLLSGLKSPKTGQIKIDGHFPYDREPSFLSSIYYLGEQTPIIKMKAVDYAKTYGVFWEGFQMRKFLDVMEVFDNDSSLRMDRMSTGQLKKTHVAFAVACNTKYLFMDEPTNGLDIPSKSQFRKALMSFVREDATVLISTHQVRDLENVIDPVIILDRKQVLLNATLEEISNRFYFDYSNVQKDNLLYSEMTPNGSIQVYLNQTGKESKINLEALFNAVHLNKALVKSVFDNR